MDPLLSQVYMYDKANQEHLNGAEFYDDGDLTTPITLD